MAGSTTIRFSRFLAVATVAAAAFALTGCSLLGNVLGGGEGVIEGEGEATDAFDIKVGDCLNDAAAGTEVTVVPRVACSEPHDSEVFASLSMDDGEFPGSDAVYGFADAGCSIEFANFVGIDYDISEFYVSWYEPTVQSWAEGDREILCVIYQTGASGEPLQTTGSLEGAAR